MELVAVKAVVLVLLGMIKLISGLAPLVFTKILKRKSDRFLKKFIGIVLCFGGGVLLSTVFIHMVVEVRESLERATNMGMIPRHMEFPFAELLICMGFLLILLIESVVHKFFGGHGHSHFPSQETLANKFARVEGLPGGRENCGYESDSPTHITIAQPELGSGPVCSPGHVAGHVYSVASASASLTSYTSHSSDTDSSQASPSPVLQPDTKSKRSELRILSSVRSFLMVFALSIHSVFEGMAIGLQETELGVWKLFMAVSIHATAVVFCIGTEMISSGTRRSRIVVYMVVLSVVTPLGVLVGIGVTAHIEHATGQHILVIGVLQGLAGGTLLYITFFEVLARDKLARYGMSGLAGATAVMLGFTVMAAMEAAGGHSHGGHGGHAHSHAPPGQAGHLTHVPHGGLHHSDQHISYHQHPELNDHEEHDHEGHGHEEHEFDSEDHDNDDHDYENIDHEGHDHEGHGHDGFDDHEENNNQFEEHNHEEHRHGDHVGEERDHQQQTHSGNVENKGEKNEKDALQQFKFENGKINFPSEGLEEKIETHNNAKHDDHNETQEDSDEYEHDEEYFNYDSGQHSVGQVENQTDNLDYLPLNITDSKFLHDSVAYD